MPEQFLHGVEVLEIDAGPRPVRTVKSSVIGIVGTAPNADDDVFPYDTPVLVTQRGESARLDLTGKGTGTLPGALDGIFDQIGAAVVVVRVHEGANDSETLASVLGGVHAQTGQYMGVHALLGAESVLGFSPRLLCAPGFTHQRVAGGILTIDVKNGGTGYRLDTTNIAIDGAGRGAAAHVSAVDEAGSITEITVTAPGSSYLEGTTTVTISGEGSAAEALASIGSVGNAVVSELQGIADRLRAIVVADGPNTTDADAIKYRGDWGSARIYMVDPWVMVYDRDGLLVSEPASARVCGMIARQDNDRGFWWSPSNTIMNGVVGTNRAIDFKLGDVNSRANLLNEREVSTIIRQDGYRLWGNRTLSNDAKWAFLNVRRTADILNESLQRAHMWAVDRNISKTYMEDVAESVNAYIRTLVNQGALLGGQCWPDPDLNSPTNLAAGKVYFNFDFTAPAAAEHITFRSQLVNDYYSEVLG